MSAWPQSFNVLVFQVLALHVCNCMPGSHMLWKMPSLRHPTLPGLHKSLHFPGKLAHQSYQQQFPLIQAGVVEPRAGPPAHPGAADAMILSECPSGYSGPLRKTNSKKQDEDAGVLGRAGG